MKIDFSRESPEPGFLERTLPITYRSVLAAERGRLCPGAGQDSSAVAFVDMVFEHYAAGESFSRS
jgi:hypothetical protein